VVRGLRFVSNIQFTRQLRRKAKGRRLRRKAKGKRQKPKGKSDG
jgi:hypothetical protein